MMTIFIEDSFDSAHWLPRVPQEHKCAVMHGHTYRVRIEIAGQVDPETGWIVDYGELKAAWEPIKRLLDHRIVNDLIENPTCELIASFIRIKLAESLPPRVRIAVIELRETERCGVVFIP